MVSAGSKKPRQELCRATADGAVHGKARSKRAAREAAQGNCSKCKKHFRAIFRGRHSSCLCQAAHVISHSMFDPALEVWEGEGGGGGGKKSGSAARNGNLAFMERNKYFKHVNSRVLSKEGVGGGGGKWEKRKGAGRVAELPAGREALQNMESIHQEQDFAPIFPLEPGSRA